MIVRRLSGWRAVRWSSGRILDRDLGQAQQRPVAALGHELGVDPEPSAGAGKRRDLGDVG